MSPFWLASLRKRFHGSSRGLRPRAPRATPLRLDTLEDRTVPATASFAGNTLTIDFTATGLTTESVTVTNNGTNILLTGNVTGATTTPTANVTRIVATASGNSTDQSLTFATGKALTLSAGLSAAGIEDANFLGSISTATADIVVDANRGVLVSGKLTTTDGKINLSGETAGPVGGDFYGVRVQGGTVQSTGSGAITLVGQASIGPDDRVGVFVSAGGKVIGGTGAVSVTGTGGPDDGVRHHGVLVNGAGSQITSTGGSVSVTGTGGGTGVAEGARGVVISNGGEISAAGTGTVTVIGTGGKGTGPSQDGVLVLGANSKITSAGGNVTVNGTAGSAGTSSVGVRLDGGAISAGGTGTVTIVGTTSTNGDDSAGVSVLNSAKILTVDGAISLTGTSTGSSLTGPSRPGIAVFGSSVSSTGSGSITFDGKGTILGVRVGKLATVQAATGSITMTGTASKTAGVEIAKSTVMTAASVAGKGNITLTGTGEAGVSLSDSSLSAVAGNIAVTGNASFSNGISVFADMTIKTTATGTNAGNITLTGKGGTNPTSNAAGISIGNFTSTNLEISTVDGDVTVVGQTPNGNAISVARGLIQSTGSGDVSLTGTASTSTGRSGVAVRSDVLTNSGKLTITGTSDVERGVVIETSGKGVGTTSGSVSITGTSTSNNGVAISAAVSAANAASIDIAGTTTSATRAGVVLSGSAGKVTSATGPINITATGNTDIQLNSPVTSAGGDITIQANRDILGNANGDISTGLSGVINLTADQDSTGTPNDAGTLQLAGDVTVGAGGLGLSLTDNDGFINGNIVSASGLVKLGTGTLQLNGTNTINGLKTVQAGTLLVNGSVTGSSPLTVDKSGTLGGTGTIAGSVLVLGTITGGTVTDVGTLTVGSLSFDGGTYHADLQGNTSDTIATAGAVNLNAGTAGVFVLDVLGGGTSEGATYTLIDNQGAGAIANPPLTNATEGGTVMVNGQTGTYTYLGGTGNDFTLTVAPATSVTYTGTGADENFQLILNGANLELYSVATIVVGPTGGITVTSPSLLMSWPAASVELVIIDGNGGSDNLLIDYASMTAGLEDVDVSFSGGGAATNSGLFVNGGTFGKIEYAPIDANDGFFGNFDAAGTSLRSIIFYDGLAPITNNSTVTDIVFDLPASGNIQAILEDDGTMGNTLSRLRSSPVAFEQTDFANPTGSLTINRGSATDDLTVNALPDFTAGLSLGSGLTPFDKLTVAGAVTLAAGKNLVGNAATINFSTPSSDVALSGAGTATLTAAQSIAMVAGSSLTTVNGDVTLSGNAAGTAGGNFDGIQVAGGTVQSKGSGAVTLTGVAGTGFTDGAGVEVSAGGTVASGTGLVTVTGTGGAGPGANEIGVSVAGGSKITSGGDVSVEGTGGAGTGDSNHGVLVTGAGSAIGSTAGTLTVTGTGGGSGASKSNVGVFVDAGGAIQASGTGAVGVLGFGGLTTGDSNSGVVVQTGGSITAVDGDVSVGGLAGGTGTASNGFGVFVNATGAAATTVAATGLGNVNVSGIGSDGTGTDNSGVIISGAAASIASGKSGGAVSVSGAAGEGTAQFGVSLRNGGAVTAVGGNVLLGGVASLTGVGGNVQLNGPVTTAGGAVDIGADNDIIGDANGDISTGGGDIILTADQDAFGAVGSAGTLQLAGDLTAGTGFISLSLADADGFLNGNIVSADFVEMDGPGTLVMNGAANAHTGLTVVNGGTLLVDGAITGTGDVLVFSGGTLGGTSSIAGEVFVGGTITGGTATTVGTLTVGGLSFDGGTYQADLLGNTSDTIATAGTVDLSAFAQGTFTLNVLGGPTTPGTTFTFIDNTGAGAIANPPLANADEGSTTNVNGLVGTFTYLGGTGNDFTMSVVAPARPQVFAVGGADGTVRLFQPDGTLLSTLTPISGYTGLVSVALGDFDGDGTADLAVAAASPLGVAGLTTTSAGKVFVFDGVDAAAGKLTLDHTFIPFATHSGPDGKAGAYTNGLNIATGDIDGDGDIDLVAGTRGQEGGPNGQPIGQAEFGRLAVVNQGAATNGSQDTLIGSIITPFGTGYQKGVVVATGNLNGLGGDEIGVTRGGPVAQNLAPRIQSLKLKAFQFSGGAILELDLSGGGFNPDGSTTQPLAPFAGLPGGRIIRDGRLAFTDQNGDGKSELVFSAIDPFTTPGSNTVRISAFDVDTGTGKATAVSTGTGPSNSYTHGSGVSVSFDTTEVAANAGVDNLAIVTTPNGSTAGTVAYLDPLSGSTLAGGFSLSVAIGGVTFDGS
ncbi:MAG: autotransporter-associated beta strand repeat-containing protein [Gemmataceae bacterium]